MDQNEMLQAVLNDPEKLQSAIAMASSLLSGTASPGAPAAPAAPAPQPAPAYDPTADLLARALPLMRQITESSQHAISPEKRNLLNAVKPFVSEEAVQQIDHGMRLVMLAHVAAAVMGQLGQEMREDGQDV